MTYTTGVLVLLVLPTAGPRPPAVAPAAEPAVRAAQEWLAEPILPAVFGDPGDDDPASPDAPAYPPSFPAPFRGGVPRPQETRPEESFPRGIGASDIQAWKEEADLRAIRETAGELLFGVPLFLPQLVLEGVLPRGVAVGPTTFLYPTNSTKSSFSLVVFDQMLFHEAQFVAQAQTYASDGMYDPGLERGQRRVLRRALMSGFRANYAMPRMTLETIVQAADEQGAIGYALAPPVVGALLYSKGIDQKVDLDPDVHLRFRLASGQRLIRAVHLDAGTPALSLELKFCNLPVGIMACFELSERGMTPSFLGLGTTLDAVEELLSREAGSAYDAR